MSSDNKAFLRYLVYSHLVRLGYKVVRTARPRSATTTSASPEASRPKPGPNGKTPNRKGVKTRTQSQRKGAEADVVDVEDLSICKSSPPEVEIIAGGGEKVELPNLFGRSRVSLTVPPLELLPERAWPKKKVYTFRVKSPGGQERTKFGPKRVEAPALPNARPARDFKPLSPNMALSSNKRKGSVSQRKSARLQNLRRRPNKPNPPSLKPPINEPVLKTVKNIFDKMGAQKPTRLTKRPEMRPPKAKSPESSSPPGTTTDPILSEGPVSALWSGTTVPLLEPRSASTTENILRRISLVSEDASSEATKDDTDLEASFDVYLPSAAFRKSDPGPPSYRVAVTSSLEPLPDQDGLDLVQDSHGDSVPLLVAVVSPAGGSIAFYCFSEIQLPIDITMG